jgi:hypothetical protein
MMFSCYDAAKQIAQSEVDIHHPARLSLAVEMSNWFWHVVNEPEKAMRLAKEAFDSAIMCSMQKCHCGSSVTMFCSLGVQNFNRYLFTEDLGEGLSESEAKQTVLLMGILRDNLVGFLSSRFSYTQNILVTDPKSRQSGHGRLTVTLRLRPQ